MNHRSDMYKKQAVTTQCYFAPGMNVQSQQLRYECGTTNGHSFGQMPRSSDRPGQSVVAWPLENLRGVQTSKKSRSNKKAAKKRSHSQSLNQSNRIYQSISLAGAISDCN